MLQQRREWTSSAAGFEPLYIGQPARGRARLETNVAGVPASSTNSAGISRDATDQETEQETDGRWLVEVPELAGVMAYGPTRAAAMAKAEALAFRMFAERLHGEAKPMPISFSLAAD